MKQSELKRKSALSRGGGLKRTPKKRAKGISPASKAQREKAKSEPCVVTGDTYPDSVLPIDPAHLFPHGCGDPLCVVPLSRGIHRGFDDGQFDLLPYLVRKRAPEMAHALEHYEGDVIALLQRLTGERWAPVSGSGENAA